MDDITDDFGDDSGSWSDLTDLTEDLTDDFGDESRGGSAGAEASPAMEACSSKSMTFEFRVDTQCGHNSGRVIVCRRVQVTLAVSSLSLPVLQRTRNRT
mmetsp:Transcript_88111/g.247783  ORF Transcript_88111/g.247783 Transcript_88111/m.247783 type:complete len:99 (+) Transcript_88111:442-738(+)